VWGRGYVLRDPPAAKGGGRGAEREATANA